MKNITRPGDRNSYYLYKDYLIVRDRDSGIYTTYTSRGRLLADTQKGIIKLINKEDLMKTYELAPTDRRKSFYGKAIVEVAPDGSETLYSYGTPIIRRTATGELVKLWDGWSATTGRHINAFCGLNKTEYMNL